MENMQTSVIGVFRNYSDAQRAVSELQSSGFSPNDVRLIENDQDEPSSTLGSDRSMNSGMDMRRTESNMGHQSNPEHRGGVMNFFSRLFGLEDDKQDTIYNQNESRQYFSDQYQKRSHLVLVYAEQKRAEAIRVLETCGGTVEDRASLLYDQELQRTGRSGRMNLGKEQVMQLREEELRTRTETVQTGEVTLRKEIVTETKNIEVPVSREEVVIERHRLSGNEVARDGNLELSENQREEIRIPVSEERVIVDKQVVPREEVSVSTRRVEGTERVSEDVKREEVIVDREGQVAMKNDQIDEDEPIDFDRPEKSKRKGKNQDRTGSAGAQPYV